MTLETILAWWNLIFILPFGMALLYLVLYAASGLTFGEADADGDIGHDGAHLGADSDHDFDADGDSDFGDHDADIDHDADLDHDAGVDGDSAETHGASHGSSPMRGALAWIGVGRVPLSILLMVMMLAWGAAGFLANQLLRDAIGEAQLALASIPIALTVSLLVTRIVVGSIERWLPLDESTARRRHDLLGLNGVAMYDISDRFGMLSVRDDRGELYQVPCRVAVGNPPLAKNAHAVLVSFNARERLYHVISAEAVVAGQRPARDVTTCAGEDRAGRAP
jgi:membrane protein implicated in regulation of membrane protease activity